jgi:hypothetical protein
LENIQMTLLITAKRNVWRGMYVLLHSIRFV